MLELDEAVEFVNHDLDLLEGRMEAPEYVQALFLLADEIDHRLDRLSEKRDR